MAFIEKREGKRGVKYRALIRVKPYAPVCKTFKRQTDAKRWAEKTELEMREGRFNVLSESRKHTLKEAIERYERQVLPRIKRSKREHILKWWKEAIGHQLIGDVSPALIVDFRDKLANEPIHQGKKRAPATIVRYLASISHVFSLASTEWQWIESNPVSKVSKPPLPRGRTRFLDEEERERLLHACQESTNDFLYVITVIALSTGMRRNEILSIRWKDVDLERGRVILHHTKNNDCRVVPLAGHALELVNKLRIRRRIDSELLFPSRDPKKGIDFRSAWRVAVKKAELEDFKFHDTRHCFASYLLLSKASLAEVGEVLGHRNVQTSKRYSHLSDSHRFNLVSSMNKKIFGAR